MKKTFLVLLVAAVGVWGYVLYRVVGILYGGSGGIEPGPSAAPAAMALLARSRPPLDTAFRDPFQSYLYALKPAPPAPKRAAVKAAPPPVLPPRAVLNGILWGDDPVAILKQDGRTELVKKGGSVWDLTVVKIEKTSVTVRKDGHTFTLEY
jgi:hypothetical protein